MGKSDATGIAVRSSSELEQVAELESILLGDRKPPEISDDPEVLSREIVARLLSAESDEELEQVGSAVGWRELEGVPVEIKGFRWRPSSYEAGSPIFFVVQGTRLDTGESIVLTTGSMNVLAQLANMAKRGTLVGAIRMLERSEKPTKGGFHPLWLVTPPEVKAAQTAADAA